MKKRLLGLMILVIIAVLALVGCDNVIVDVPAKQYTVSFDVDGGSYIAPIKVDNGGFVTKPQDPTKEGFDFAGWYKDAARTEEWIFSSHKITGNTTLYAKWVDHVHVGGAATCEESAVCSVCGESYGAALGHTPVTDKAVAPTCGKDGLTEGSHCDVCGKVLVAQEAVSATGSHAWGEWVTDKEATEDADGAQHRDCSVCGAKEEGIIPSLIHQHSYESKVTIDPGCETKGEMTFTCKCSHSYTEEIPATGHDYDAVITDPTCEAKGYTTYTCECGDTYTADEVAALGHAWNDGEVTVPATYGHKGTKTFTCQNDASHTKKEDIEQVKLADNATAAEIVNAAYSLEKGEALIGEFTLTGVITKVDFAYNSYNKNISITIKVTGADESKTIYCYKLVGDDIDKIVAGDTVTITGPIKNYDGKVEFDQGCTLVDYTEHKHQWSDATCKVLATCSICKKTTGEFADHTYGADNKCTVCGHDKNSKESWVLVTDVAQLKDGAEIVIVASKYNVAMSTIQRENNRGSVNVAKDGNTVTINSDVQIIVLGITEDGKYTFFVSGCTNLDGEVVEDGYLYAASSSKNYLRTQKTNNANGTWTIEISESGVATVKAQGSNTRNWLRYNDATNNGQLFSCYGSGQTDISIYVKTTKTAHTCTPADAVKENEVAPTCTTAGSYDEVVYCSECEKEISRRTVTVDALGHDMKTDAAVAPTCESTGLTEGSHCSRCDHKVAQEVVPALGHDWNDGVVTTKPTCTAAGEKTFTCQNDATHTKTENVAATGHTEVVDAAVAATCTTTGLTEGKHCSVCNTVIVAQTEIPVVPHTYDDKYDATCNKCGFVRDAECAHTTTETITGKAATCTSAGLTDGKKCSKCGEILEAQTEIAALGHTEVVDAKVDATCTTAGKTEGKHCSVCNEVLIAQTVVAALGHTPVVDAKVDATCTTAGKTEGKHCSVCEEVLVAQTTVAALGHTEVVDAAVAATCTTAGKTEGKHCSVCNEVLTAQEEVAALGHKDENGDYLCDSGCKTLMEPVADSTLTLEEANKLAAAIDSISDSTKYTTNKYYIVGTVKNIANPTYGNPTIVDEDGNEFYSYGMYDTDGETKYEKLEYKPVKGDVVTLYGTIGIYVKNGVASNQMNNGILTNVVPHNHDWSHEATCDAPATCNICGKQNAVAHTRSAEEATCVAPIICTECEKVIETADHVDENENCRCDVCKEDLSTEGIEGKTITFDFGANGSAAHVDGNDYGTSKSFTSGDYELNLASMSKVFGPAYDLMGNSCIKLGTSKVTGGFTFTVPDDVTSVIIYVAGYKGATSTNIKINGTQHNVKTTSDKGEYTAIEIDTTTTKTITFVTVTYRAMINTIEFIVPGKEGAQHVHNVATKEENRVESTCTVEGHYDLVTYCADADCGKEISRTTFEIPALTHSYTNYVYNNDAKCGENGTKTAYCDHGCGETSTITAENTALEHVWTNDCDTDCNRTGCTETRTPADHVYDNACDTTCNVCQATRTITHSWKNATCDLPKTCETCGATEGTKLDHSYTTYALEVRDNTVKSVSYCDNNCGTDHVQGVPTSTEIEIAGENSESLLRAALENGYSVVLAEDVNITETITLVNGQIVTIDLAGHTITANWATTDPNPEGLSYNDPKYKYVVVEVLYLEGTGTTVTIKDSSEGKTGGMISGDETSYSKDYLINSVISVLDGATLNIYSGNFYSANIGDVVFARSNTENNLIGTVNIYGGKFEAANALYGTYYVLDTRDTAIDRGIFNVYGGQFVNFDPANHSNDGNYTNKLAGTGYHSIKDGNVYTVSAHTYENDQYRCDACGANKCEHSYTQKTTAPTCTAAGYTTYTCSVCGDSYVDDEVVALGHTAKEAVKENIVVETCTTAGSYNSVVYCSACNAELSRTPVVVDSLGHAEVPHDAKDATCTEGGHKAYVTCSRCNYTTYEATEKLGHDEVPHDAKAPTCTEIGWNAYVTCNRSGCDYTTYVEIPATKHSYTSSVTAPKCTADGYTTHTCSVCGDTYKDSTVPALGHTKGNKVETAPTCTEEGYTTYTCSKCGESYTDDEIPATGVHPDADGDYLCDYEGCDKVIEPADGTALTFEQAKALANLFAHDKYTTNKYYVTGIITEVYNTQYGNIKFEGTDFIIYGLYSADGKTRYDAMTYKPVKGDEITVYGVIGKYINSTTGEISLQIKNGWLDEVVKHECDYAPATCAVPATCKICGVAKDDVLSTEHDYVDGVCSVCGATESTGGEVVVPTTVTVSIADYAAANGWANSTQYKTLEADHNIVVTVTDTTGTYHNTGKYYTSGNNWRIYQNEAPQIVFTASNGATIVSVKITYTVSNTGVLTLNGNNISSDAVVDVNAASVEFSVGNTDSATNGQIRITAIEVVYSGGSAPCAHTTDETLWGDGEVTTAATCTTAGVKTFTCEVCGDSKREAIPVDSTAHNLVDVEAKEATCTADGYTAHKDCSNCDYTEGKETIEALGHTTENGTCERCNETIGGSTVTSKTTTMTSSSQGYSNGNSVDGKTITSDSIQFTFNKGSGQSAPAYYTTGSGFRLYGKNTLTISANSGVTITKITITTHTTSYTFRTSDSITGGTWTGVGSTTITITPTDNVIVLMNNASSGNIRIQKIVVEYTE